MKTLKIGDKANVVHNGQQVRGLVLSINNAKEAEPGFISEANAQELVDLGKAEYSNAPANASATATAPATANVPATPPAGYGSMTKAQLAAMAADRAIPVTRTDGASGDLRKEDYIAALTVSDEINAEVDELQ